MPDAPQELDYLPSQVQYFTLKQCSNEPYITSMLWQSTSIGKVINKNSGGELLNAVFSLFTQVVTIFNLLVLQFWSDKILFVFEKSKFR